jgi:hypothetical protein
MNFAARSLQRADLRAIEKHQSFRAGDHSIDCFVVFINVLGAARRPTIFTVKPAARDGFSATLSQFQPTLIACAAAAAPTALVPHVRLTKLALAIRHEVCCYGARGWRTSNSRI